MGRQRQTDKDRDTQRDRNRHTESDGGEDDRERISQVLERKLENEGFTSNALSLFACSQIGITNRP